MTRIFFLCLFFLAPQVSYAGKIGGSNSSSESDESDDENDFEINENDALPAYLLQALNFDDGDEQDNLLPPPSSGLTPRLGLDGPPGTMEHGVLGQMLYSPIFQTSTWYEPFLTALAPLDVLSFAALSREARERIEGLWDGLRNHLRPLFILDIEERETLHRWSTLPVHTLPHLMGLRFANDDHRDISPQQVVRFLDERAPYLTRLEVLGFSGLRNVWEQLLAEALSSEQLRRLLLQTHLPIVITFESAAQLARFIQHADLIHDSNLDALLELEFAADGSDFPSRFFEQLRHPLIVRRLHFATADGLPQFMPGFAERLDDGYIQGLRVLEFIDSGLQEEDYELLSELIAMGRLVDLESLEFDDSIHGNTLEGALGVLVSALLQAPEASGFLPKLSRFAFLTGGHLSPVSIRAFVMLLNSGGLPALRTLELGGDLEDNLIQGLIEAAAQLQNLETLDLSEVQSRSALSPQLLNQLRAALPKCRIRTNHFSTYDVE